jgi:hypothetical protein
MVNLRLAVLASLVVGPALAHADKVDHIKVAVVPGIAVNLDAARVDALSQDLADALQTELDIDAVGGLEVRRLLPADGLAPDCVTEPACTADVAKRLGAQQLLFVVMVQSGGEGSVQIDPTWVDPAAGKSVSRPAVDLMSTLDSDAKAKFQTVARLLLPDAPVRPKPKTGGGIDGQLTGGAPRHLTTPAKITAAVGVVALASGITFGVLTSGKYGDCNHVDMPCTDSQKDTIRRNAAIADASFVIAAGCAVATLALYATSAESPHLILAPASEHGGVSLTAVGRF